MQSRERIDRGQIRSGCRVTKLCGLDVTGTEDGPACCLRDVMKSSFQVTSGCLCYPVLQAAGRGIGGFSPCCFSFLSLFFFLINLSKVVGKGIFGQWSESVCSDAAQGTKYTFMLPCCSNDRKKLFALLLSSVPCCGQHFCPFRKLIESIIKDSYTRLEKNTAPWSQTSTN